MNYQKVKRATAFQLDSELRTVSGLSAVNKVIVFVVLLSILGVILETEPTIYDPYTLLFQWFEWVILTFFIIEYALRVWSSTENPKYPNRLSYCLSLVSLVDLFVIANMGFTLIGVEGGLLRLLRLVRLMRLAKLGKYTNAMGNISEAISSRKFELIVSLVVALGLLILSSSALYVIEGGGQPETFGSIPRAMWWATATLTTVGYGDTVPITGLGRVFAAITAITGIGLIALPAGILASAFSDAMKKRREDEQDGN
jgi:voltage-gated potassium channel